MSTHTSGQSVILRVIVSAGAGSDPWGGLIARRAVFAVHLPGGLIIPIGGERGDASARRPPRLLEEVA